VPRQAIPDAFAEHAFEEADHPEQLTAWMDKHGFLEGGEAGSVPASQETINTLAFCWRAAVHEPRDVQATRAAVDRRPAGAAC
jgi:hypothetical protein